MVKTENEIQCYFRLPERLVKKLDRKLKRLGYSSRTDLFTAFVYLLLENSELQEEERKKQSENLLFRTALQIQGDNKLTETQISIRLRKLIDAVFKPAVAMKGVDAAYSAGVFDIREEFYRQNGLWLTNAEIREGFEMYSLVNRNALRNYQLCQVHHIENKLNDA